LRYGVVVRVGFYAGYAAQTVVDRGEFESMFGYDWAVAR
jgi:hypothetical protein